MTVSVEFTGIDKAREQIRDLARAMGEAHSSAVNRQALQALDVLREATTGEGVEPERKPSEEWSPVPNPYGSSWFSLGEMRTGTVLVKRAQFSRLSPWDVYTINPCNEPEKMVRQLQGAYSSETEAKLAAEDALAELRAEYELEQESKHEQVCCETCDDYYDDGRTLAIYGRRGGSCSHRGKDVWSDDALCDDGCHSSLREAEPHHHFGSFDELRATSGYGLDMRALDYGVKRMPCEKDGSLRQRIVNVALGR